MNSENQNYNINILGGVYHVYLLDILGICMRSTTNSWSINRCHTLKGAEQKKQQSVTAWDTSSLTDRCLSINPSATIWMTLVTLFLLGLPTPPITRYFFEFLPICETCPTLNLPHEKSEQFEAFFFIFDVYCLLDIPLTDIYSGFQFLLAH